MRKVIISAVIVAFAMVSCNQKTKETSDESHDMGNGSTMMDNDTTMMDDKTKMKENHEKMYACSMHPEMQGKLNDKCLKCGMDLTEPVPEKE